MTKVTFKGTPFAIAGNLPAKGSIAPEFVLTKTDLSDVRPAELRGKKVLLNIFPSLDTPVCATSVRTFNAKASAHPEAIVLCVSKDLPFAHSRFCVAEGLERVVPASELRGQSFGESYGVRITEGPLAGLFARAVVVLDEQGKVIYQQLVPEIAQEPDYEAALAALR
jgi:thioredoxin-dependent peroxiredoxin